VPWLVDYSYGIYLYGFPLQQVISYLWPEYIVWYVNFALGFCAALLCAVLSWHGLEHPILRRKAWILGVVQRALDAVPFKRRA
jgi:peptidoglycan/LPS O-acetylase OafA/YrhL